MPRCDIIYKLRVSSRFQRPEKSSPVFAFPYRLQETGRQFQGRLSKNPFADVSDSHFTPIFRLILSP